ncbi:cellulose synthase [Paraburkholderia sp. CNPSo 3274]|uniref:cellulose biosynthesis protein BcsD n=1 Tax=Paraburkholderia sp. CNPSo 3274 TaxID=2940932 RepID=UPI0020B769BE|nr:cellulose synthase [Paraburkholderia sp. CNPSo 3274]MCP3709844.1 cellulose synthase [Paraburkholderia sp. CNPSo 3274]
MPAPQWRPFLSFLTQELTQNLTPRFLTQLMRAAGGQFARQYALGEAGTVAAMREAMNQVWGELDWGQVEIREAQDWLVLTHYYAPLKAVFGAENVAWAAAFLEGAYEAWMHQLGADSQLRMTTAGPADASGTLVFLFGK